MQQEQQQHHETEAAGKKRKIQVNANFCSSSFPAVMLESAL